MQKMKNHKIKEPHFNSTGQKPSAIRHPRPALVKNPMKSFARMFLLIYTMCPLLANGAIVLPISEIDPFTFTFDDSGLVSRSSTPLNSAEGFTSDFGELGDTALTASFSFDPGYELVINTPIGFDSVQVNFTLSFDNATSFTFTDPSPILAIEGNAAAIGLESIGNRQAVFDAVGEPNILMTVGFSLNPGEFYRFQSINLTAQVPAAYNESFSEAFPQASGLMLTASSFFGSPEDPGDWASIQPIPEPSTFALFTGSAVLLLALTRRLRK